MSTPRDRIEARLGLTGPPLQAVRDSPPTIPDHELTRRIGQGAYGEVWLARNAIGTWRAVKIVFLDNFKDARPYEREFAGIRRFEPLSRANEGFVDILQVGRDENGGWFYYVMELADAAEPRAGIQCSVTAADSGSPEQLNTPALKSGYSPRTLSRDLHHRGRLPLDECLTLGLTLSLALGHLHRHGLIHRDVKPSNIIFVGGVPKLADIGLVTEAAGANTFVGTEGFIPPEGPTSPQADLYALGKVLYEAAMGKDRNEFPEPFTQIGTDSESVALMELNAVLLRACAPNPKARYASAEEMHADLALLHSGGSVKRRHQFDQQFKLAKRVGTVAIIATLLVGGAWLWQQQQTRKMTRMAEEKAAIATEKTRLADNLTKLDAENRNRTVRLNIANGVRLLDEGDPAGALLWFADALPLLSHKPAEETIHRIRIQQTLDQTPRLLRVLPDDSSLLSSAYSPDGRFIATGTFDGKLTVWDAGSGSRLWGPKAMGAHVYFVRFSRDGQRLFACSSPQQKSFNSSGPMPNFFAVLDARSGREVFSATEVLPGMSTNLFWSTFSPDQRWLAVSQRGAVVRVFNLRDGRPVTELRGHTDEVLFLSFSADGSLLASASADKTVRLWHLPSGEPVGRPLEHRLPVMRAILTDDGRHLVTGSLAESECEIQAWDVPTGRRVGEPLKGQEWITMFVEPGAGGRFFGGVSGGKDDFTRAWHLASFSEALPTFEMANSQCWAFSPDGKRLAIGGDDYMARVWSLETGELMQGPFRHNRWVHSVQFSPDGTRLLTGSDDGNARLWDLRHPPMESARRVLPAPIRKLRAESFGMQVGQSPSRTPILLEDGTVRIISDQLEELHRLTSPQPGTTIHAPASATSGKMWSLCRYGTGQNDPTALFLWHQEGEELKQLTLQHPDPIVQHVFTSDGHYQVTYCSDRVIRFWRTSDGILERTVEVLSLGDGYVAVILPDAGIALWHGRVAEKNTLEWLDLNSGKIIAGPVVHSEPLNGIEFSRDAARLALADPNGPVTILDGKSGRFISSAIKHSANLTWVEWSPDGERLLTAGHNEEVLVWDVQTSAQLLGPLRTPGGVIRVARWSPDGRFIITRNDDKQVRVWDAATGEAVTPLLKHSGDIRFAFMTRSHRLITASHPDLLRAWDLKETSLPPDALADYAKLLSGRRLNVQGVQFPLRPEELAELDRSLRSRAPQLFE